MSTDSKHSRAALGVLWCAGVAAALVLNATSLWRGDLNQDEGWYLYGARLVAEGQRPYVDFATTQGPVMSYVYACAEPLVRRWGLAGGRLFTSLLGFAGALGAAWLAWRLARPVQDAPATPAAGGGHETSRHAALLTFYLVGVNVFQSYFTTIVKTYALAAFWLVAAMLLLSAARGRAGRAAAAAAGICMTLAAAATRVSAVVAAGITALALLAARDVPRAAARQRAAWFIAGGAASALAVFLPFFLAAPESTWFCLVQYHAGREVDGIVSWLAYKAGFVARLCLAYATAASLALGLLARRVCGPRIARQPDWLLAAVAGSVAGVTVMHGAAPFPYDDYQAMIYPLFAVLLAVWLVRRVTALWLTAAVCAACLVAAAASPIVQGWFIGPRDRIWWPLKAQAPLAVLQEAARTVRSLPGVTPGAELLTQDPYLAVEAGLALPRGMELGQFCYFSDWSDARARQCHVLNARLLRDLLRDSPAPAAAFSGYGFAIRSPEVQPLSTAEHAELWQLLEARYAPVDAVEPFGQADTRLRILARRPD